MTTITLPPEIEEPLAEAARKQGTTPERLALDSLRQLFVPASTNGEVAGAQTLFDFLQGYIGIVAGSGEAGSEKCGERFGDILIEKPQSSHR
jgi:hypothetical protein